MLNKRIVAVYGLIALLGTGTGYSLHAADLDPSHESHPEIRMTAHEIPLNDAADPSAQEGSPEDFGRPSEETASRFGNQQRTGEGVPHGAYLRASSSTSRMLRPTEHARVTGHYAGGLHALFLCIRYGR